MSIAKLFGAEPAIISPPPIISPPVMPTPDDEAGRRARKQSLAAQYSRRGRSSTILSDRAESEALGG